MEPLAAPPAKKLVGRITAQGAACLALLILHGVVAVHSLRQHYVTVDEGGHVLSGLLAWEAGRVDVYAVNPPLVKALVALPVFAARPQLPEGVTSMVSSSWLSQHEQFVHANRECYLDLIYSARYVLVALSILGGWLMYRWASQLFGPVSGLIALALWALCPNVLAWAGVCTVDLGATVFGLAAAYAFRYYLHHPGWPEAAWAGFVLGLALLSKFTLLVLYPVFLLVWLAAWWRGRDSAAQPATEVCWLHLGAILLVSSVVINLGYGFQGTGRPLGSFVFKSHLLAGGSNGWANRFHDTWLESIPVPLPGAFVSGLDEQKSHADVGFVNYLRGEWRHGGWWYYYFIAAAVKVPLGSWLLGLLALGLACLHRHFRAPAMEELVLWLSAAAIIVLISSQTGINGHFRYMLPAFPFVFVGISRVGKLAENAWRSWRQPRSAATGRTFFPAIGAGIILAAMTWNGLALLRTHPHYLSYFNEVAGGPDNGWKWLAESNIDWGQDLLFVKRWVQEHPEARPLGLAYYGGDPHLVGLEYRLPPDRQTGPQPGWYAVSVNLVCGAAFGGYDEHGQKVPFPRDAFSYFRHFTPVAKAGYSIFIYSLTLEEANRVRYATPNRQGRGKRELSLNPYSIGRSPWRTTMPISPPPP